MNFGKFWGKLNEQPRVVVTEEKITLEVIEIPLIFPIGHFYSPIADPKDIAEREAIIWKKKDSLPSIDLNVDYQLALLKQLKQHVQSITYPTQRPTSETQYFYENDQYPVLDAEFLHTALFHFQPRNVIEVGSGFSSLITAEVNIKHFNCNINFACIEPFPRQFLLNGVPGISQLVQQKVENVPLEYFDKLETNDILFIDSSHVSKIGSDVNYLFFEVLPRLKAGVIVHIHDIFLPDEYPKTWVNEGRNWNEQYLVQAFLQFNSSWRIIWAANFMGTRFKSAVQDVFPKYPSIGGGGSLWIQRM
jgi:predicted O-methyltransferase YrrM